MKTQFTPGPWQVEVIDGSLCNTPVGMTVKFTEDHLYRRFYASRTTLFKEDLANATLIADCPTLLNVLHKCFITLQGEYPKDQWEEYYPEILEAKALLEKHLGDLGLEE